MPNLGITNLVKHFYSVILKTKQNSISKIEHRKTGQQLNKTFPLLQPTKVAKSGHPKIQHVADREIE